MKKIILSKVMQQFSNNVDFGVVLRENYNNGNSNYNIDEKHVKNIVEMVEKQPNDYALGYQVRNYIKENL